ncbi:MAG: lasso peptide biosynthesis B2 protein [Leptolyngbya sp. SIO1E4]|nr:lasso peptide biosynthesis B2 protein [Leptolyngbya sp. SIO1E4]
MQRILKLLTKFRRLQRRDLLLLITAFLLLGTVRLGLWLMPFHALFKLLMGVDPSVFANKASSRTTEGEALDACHQSVTQSRRVAKIVWSVNVASRYMPGKVKCLARALATQVLMNWHQCVSELRIGVDKTPEGGVRAHAWIEYQGRVIIGNLNDLSQFKPLFAYRGIEP